MPLNVKILRKVQIEILMEPRRLSMQKWFREYTKLEVATNNFLPSCGTVGCIAGWVKAIAIREGFKVELFGTANNACSILDITEDESYSLFYTDAWPKDLSDKYFAADKDDFKGKAQITCEAIERFIAAYEVKHATTS